MPYHSIIRESVRIDIEIYSLFSSFTTHYNLNQYIIVIDMTAVDRIIIIPSRTNSMNSCRYLIRTRTLRVF